MEGRRVAAHCRPEAVDREPGRACLTPHVGGRVVRAARILVPRDCPLSGNPNRALDRQVLAVRALSNAPVPDGEVVTTPQPVLVAAPGVNLRTLKQKNTKEQFE
jgi:hypothetical protein